ncbi:MAG: 4-hydroxy-3-methylbut-2-enyl diphosphate reductase [Verrucomicrobiae bacterium]|nr:4-hydroxy-3-methylbut-2-enyl diphosphate reductase [Verrucomicrobiae bacterium]
MSTASATEKTERVNLRRPDIMELVHAQVETHYRSNLVDHLRRNGGILHAGDLKVKLAKEFGFCYGVERAIDLAYAARKVFTDKNIYIVGEIIHNPEVNEQIRAMGIKTITGPNKVADIEDVTAQDIVIIPAFGAEVKVMEHLKRIGCQLVDTTCGDVMSVWKRVRQYSRETVTSIIHGKAQHEETKATSSRASYENGGHYLVILTLDDTDYVCNYIRHGGNKAEFLKRFEGAVSPGFDPDIHLRAIGVANQTTMMRGETEEVQRRLQRAISERDGEEEAKKHFRVFDTICGATQDRQDALQLLLREPLDLLIVVGGYNSSNTTHLAEMGEAVLPTYFIRDSSKMISDKKIVHFDRHLGKEVETENWLPSGAITVGITAGASCPNNLIEESITRLFELRGVNAKDVLPHQNV